jgi:mRNA interferase MazF
VGRLATKPGRAPYVPQRGDVVWLTFDPQAGHEQAGRRPGVVLSPAIYNTRSGLALLVPVTSQVKGYPFEVVLPEGLEISGAVLADHIKSLDWRARKAELICRLPATVTAQVMGRAAVLLGPSG